MSTTFDIGAADVSDDEASTRRRTAQVSVAPTAVGRPVGVGAAPPHLSSDPRPTGALAPKGWPLGRAAPDDDRPPHRQERSAILGYYEDGPNLVTLAMNGWAAPEPAWWLNLQSQPDATVELKGQRIKVRGRAALGDERARLWERWYEMGDDVDGYATRRPSETAVVVLEPR